MPRPVQARGGPLDALRFFAAFFIVVYHAGTDAPVALDHLGPLFQRGYLATDYFLMLSGYVLGRAYGARVASGGLGLWRFLSRRLMRLWPAHLIVLVGFALVVAVAERGGVHLNRPGWFAWANWPSQALLVHGWGFDIGGGWNLPSWSLSALMICYALFPLIWRVQGRAPALAVALAAAAMLACADRGALIFLHQAFYDLPPHLGVVRALPLFALGVAIARLTQDFHGVSVRAGWIWMAAGAAALFGLQCFGRLDFLSMLAIGAVIFGAGCLPAGGLTAEGSRLAAMGGRISFSLFITHGLSATLWFGGLHSLVHGVVTGAAGWLLWSGGMAFALMVAVLFERFVDQPVQAGLKRPVSWRALIAGRRSAEA